MYGRITPQERDVCYTVRVGSVVVYTTGIGYARALTEGEQMSNRFSEEWERYVTKVRCWFFPGLVWTTESVGMCCRFFLSLLFSISDVRRPHVSSDSFVTVVVYVAGSIPNMR
jgi:hypothetical protein